MIKHRILIFAGVSGVSCLFQFRIQVLERFSYDLESENARTKQKQRADTNARGFWLIKRSPSGEKTSCLRTSRINRYFALTSYCNRLVNRTMSSPY